MSFIAIVLWLSAGAAQEPSDARSATVPKQERSTYIPVLEKYREAEAVLATKPLDCANRCTELIDDKAVKEAYREARVRVQNTDGSYGDYMLYVPLQLRGRARVALAQAVADSDRPKAYELSQRAVVDLDESVRRGVKSSGPYLEQAQKLESSLRPSAPAADPRVVKAGKRIEELNQLWEQNKEPETLLRRCDEYAEDVKGTGQQGEWRRLRDGAVRALADRFQVRLRETLPPAQAWTTLKGLTPAEFDRRFALPADPALEWSGRCRGRLLQVRALSDPPAAPLVDFLKVIAELTQAAAGENQAFAPLEALVHDLSRLRLEGLLARADALPADELRARREEGSRGIGAFKDFMARLDKDLAAGQRSFLLSQLQSLEGLAARFPVDLARIDEIGKELFDAADPKGAWGDSPREALKRVEEELIRLEQREGPPLTKDSLRKLATYLLVARASRLLLAGERVDDVPVRGDFRDIGRWLKEAGGPVPDVMSRVSPKVRAVAAKLNP